MLSGLANFDRITAAGILARAALAIEDEDNPAGVPKIPEERSVRHLIIAEARQRLGVSPHDTSPQTLERLGDVFDTECESLLGSADSKQALERLSDKGELPSDLFKIEVIPQIAEWHGRKYKAEKLLIESTVRAPDREQHFGPPGKTNGPFLISLFAKFFLNKYERKSFTMLVAGQRHGLVLTIHQAWRLYAELVSFEGVTTLVEMLERFSETFGTEAEVNGKRGKFILVENIPTKQDIEVTLPGNPKVPRVALSWFLQKDLKGTLNQAALVNAIDLNRYEEAIRSRLG